ncbi:hypothetical protein Tco_0150858 [Tanacetum coccineum]
MSKKKAPVKAKQRKGIELLSEVALLEEAQLKKAIKRRKRETNIHQAGGLSEEDGLEQEVLDEQKGKSIDTSEGTGLKLGVPDVSKADSSESEYESWGDSDDDDDDDDQQGDDKRTKLYNDKAAELNKTYDEEEDEFVRTPDDYVPTDDENVNDEEYDRINEEMYSDVNVELKETKLEKEGKDDEEMTYAGHVDAENKNVNQEVAEATITTTSAPNSTTLTVIHQRLSDLENEVMTLRNVDHSSTIHSSIKSKIPKVVKQYLGTSLDDTLHKKSAADIHKIKMEQAGKHQETKYTITSSDTAELQEFDQKRTFKDAQPSKKAKSTKTSKGTTKSQLKSTGKSAQAEERVFEGGDAQVLQNIGEDMVDNKPTQKWLGDLAKAEKPSKTFNDLMRTPIDFSTFAMNRLQISDLTQDILIIPVDYFFNNDLAYLQGGSTDRTYTNSLTMTKAAKYDLDKVLKLKNFKKDDYTSFQDQEKYEHVGPKAIRTQEGKISQDDDKRFYSDDDLKKLKDHTQVKLKGTSSSPKSKDHYAYHKLKDKDSRP